MQSSLDLTDATAKDIAEREGVDLRLYRVIYNAIEDVEAAMKGMLDPVFEEKVLGHAEVRQTFKASGVGTIAGAYVLDGIFERNCSVRLIRDGIVVFDGPLASLKRFKDDVKEESLMMSSWPVYREDWEFPYATEVMEHVKAITRGIRNMRAEMNVPNNRKTSLHIVAKDADTAAMYENSKKSFVNLAFAKEILVQTDKNGISEDAVSVVVSNAVVYMPLEDLIDKDKEIERLTKETERLTKEIARCEGMLNNPNFVNKAPAAKVDAEKDKLAKYKEMMDKVKGQLEQLKK